MQQDMPCVHEVEPSERDVVDGDVVPPDVHGGAAPIDTQRFEMSENFEEGGKGVETLAWVQQLPGAAIWRRG
ncbi:MAG: hypothetical protein AB7L91_17330 [Dehalococcoidia bacterium]